MRLRLPRTMGLHARQALIILALRLSSIEPFNLAPTRHFSHTIRRTVAFCQPLDDLDFDAIEVCMVRVRARARVVVTVTSRV